MIRACAVSALKQVRSQTDSKKLLFVAVIAGSGDVFLTLEQASPLLDEWGIQPEDIPHLDALPADLQERARKRSRAFRRVQRAKDNLRKVQSE